jgi:hypothetical protein
MRWTAKRRVINPEGSLYPFLISPNTLPSIKVERRVRRGIVCLFEFRRWELVNPRESVACELRTLRFEENFEECKPGTGTFP